MIPTKINTEESLNVKVCVCPPLFGFRTTTNLSARANGSHNITVYANDTFGNIGTSISYFFIGEPFPTARVIAVFAVTVVFIVTALLVYFKKRKR